MPSRDPKAPLKCNILWIISEGYVLDIGQFYTFLREMRDNMPIHLIKVENEDRMPDEPEFKDTNKHKYTQIERAIVKLQRDGWPIVKEKDNNGIAWYYAGHDFTEFMIKRLFEHIGKIPTMIKKIEKTDDFYGIYNTLRKRDESRIWVPKSSVKRSATMRKIRKKELKELKNILKDI